MKNYGTIDGAQMYLFFRIFIADVPPSSEDIDFLVDKFIYVTSLQLKNRTPEIFNCPKKLVVFFEFSMGIVFQFSYHTK